MTSIRNEYRITKRTILIQLPKTNIAMSNAGKITTEIENKIANDYKMRNSIRNGIDRCVPDVFSQ